jgi:hypothetical protein
MTRSAELRSAALAPADRRVPDFFIVGHFKSGTTALYRMLKRHPQIYLPDVKEMWFLSSELRPGARPSRADRQPETLDEYLAHYERAGPEQRAGDNSPSYLMSHLAAARIAELQPNARIVAILREPASFLHSFHLQAVKNHFESETDLRAAMALEPERRQGRNIPRDCTRPQELLYSEHVRYVEQLRRYHDVFPREQVLVLIYEDFRADNDATVRRVLRFLDVDDTLAIEVTEANPTVRVRSPRLYEHVRSLYMGRGPLARAVKPAIKAVTSQKLRRNSLGALRRRVLWTEPEPPDQQLMLELRRRFKGEVLALSEYLDRDLVSLWGYDRID